jgi:hypothetical protein
MTSDAFATVDGRTSAQTPRPHIRMRPKGVRIQSHSVTSASAFQPIPVSHLGFLCDAPKRAVLPAGSGTRFVLQDMGIHTKENARRVRGLAGRARRRPVIDVEMRMDRASTEYWNLSLANLLQALAHLIRGEVPAERKLGLRRY